VRILKSNSLALFIVMALLAIIVVVLILPDVDLPDTAFQRNSSLQVLRTLSHPIAYATSKTGPTHRSFQFENASTPLRHVEARPARFSSDLPIEHQALRC
jgi:hypothetical protein